MANLRMRLLGFVNDDPALCGQEVVGHQVLGVRAALAEQARTLRVTEIVVAIPNLSAIAIRSWEANWESLSTYFDYPQQIRRL